MPLGSVETSTFGIWIGRSGGYFICSMVSAVTRGAAVWVRGALAGDLGGGGVWAATVATAIHAIRAILISRLLSAERFRPSCGWRSPGIYGPPAARLRP